MSATTIRYRPIRYRLLFISFIHSFAKEHAIAYVHAVHGKTTRREAVLTAATKRNKSTTLH